jgi:peptidoglycan hydrolase FlgJ
MEISSSALGPTLPLGADPQALASQARSGDSRATAAIATGFESLFLAQLVKEMRQTLEPGTLFGNDNADIHGGLFDMYLGQHLAQAGGLGIANMVKQQLGHRKT